MKTDFEIVISFIRSVNCKTVSDIFIFTIISPLFIKENNYSYISFNLTNWSISPRALMCTILAWFALPQASWPVIEAQWVALLNPGN